MGVAFGGLIGCGRAASRPWQALAAVFSISLTATANRIFTFSAQQDHLQLEREPHTTSLEKIEALPDVAPQAQEASPEEGERDKRQHLDPAPMCFKHHVKDRHRGFDEFP